VKWFNSQKGYGFIQPQSGGKDVFVHISAVERAGLSGLNEGQVIEYEEVSNKGKTSAENLKVQRWVLSRQKGRRAVLFVSHGVERYPKTHRKVANQSRSFNAPFRFRFAFKGLKRAPATSAFKTGT
jgi:cold shock protein